MKIRTGLVSNSSSSSFMIVGVKRNFDDLIEALCPGIWDDDSYLYYEGYGTWKSPSEVISIYGGDEPQYIGIDAAKAFVAGETFQGLRSLFIQEAKKYGVDIPENKVDLHYGECGNG